MRNKSGGLVVQPQHTVLPARQSNRLEHAGLAGFVGKQADAHHERVEEGAVDQQIALRQPLHVVKPGFVQKWCV